jgi:flagellar motor protein MotB
LRRSRQRTEDKGMPVPAYIVTFSDMVTLLLTFFVMLLSLADVQDPELFNKGRDAFVRSIRYIGLGALFGRNETPDFGDYKPKYTVPEPEETQARRNIDAKTEELRRIFLKLRQISTVLPSQIDAGSTSISVTSVHFPPERAELDDPSKKFITDFCRNLRQNSGQKDIELYVLGLAPDAKTEKDKWILSANRAQAVADFMSNVFSSITSTNTRNSLFTESTKCSVYSWGAGPGGVWVGSDSPISAQSQILIAVLR